MTTVRLTGPNGEIVDVGGATPEEQAAKVAEWRARWAGQQARKRWLADSAATWANARGTLTAFLAGNPAPPAVVRSLTLAAIDSLAGRDDFNHSVELQIAEYLIGVGDAIMTLAKALADLYERSDVAPPA